MWRPEDRLDRTLALRLFTGGSAWFTGDQRRRGALEPGMLADFAVLSADYFSVPEAEMAGLESVLTVVGGKVVYAAGRTRSGERVIRPSLASGAGRPDRKRDANAGGYPRHSRTWDDRVRGCGEGSERAMSARGKLRVYLGAAPGVGKTYHMLDEAQRRAERGGDVVVGFVETHDRPHTQAMLDGLEIVPRRRMEYRGSDFEEMDIDAILERRPSVVLVDELAHTNVPGSRNAKRWQDVEELLAAGIDVIASVNVQHLESLNDVVQKITGVPQRETVPDEVVRSADQIELIDMAPEALRRRMAHGNIYKPEKIDAALSNYFRPGNLGALRELALLWVAGRVDEALQRYRDQHGIDKVWETRERVVVALTGGPEGATLIRARRAHRAAARRQGLGPAGRARGPLRRPDRRLAGAAGRAAGSGGVPGRDLPLGGRRRHPQRAAAVRARRERHAAGDRRVAARPGGAVPGRLRHRRDRGAAVRRHRRAHGHPRALGGRRRAAGPGCGGCCGSRRRIGRRPGRAGGARWPG